MCSKYIQYVKMHIYIFKTNIYNIYTKKALMANNILHVIYT
jgi:hypothetical protein